MRKDKKRTKMLKKQLKEKEDKKVLERIFSGKL